MYAVSFYLQIDKSVRMEDFHVSILTHKGGNLDSIQLSRATVCTIHSSKRRSKC